MVHLLSEHSLPSLLRNHRTKKKKERNHRTPKKVLMVKLWSRRIAEGMGLIHLKLRALHENIKELWTAEEEIKGTGHVKK